MCKSSSCSSSGTLQCALMHACIKQGNSRRLPAALCTIIISLLPSLCTITTCDLTFFMLIVRSRSGVCVLCCMRAQCGMARRCIMCYTMMYHVLYTCVASSHTLACLTHLHVFYTWHVAHTCSSNASCPIFVGGACTAVCLWCMQCRLSMAIPARMSCACPSVWRGLVVCGMAWQALKMTQPRG